LNVAHNTEILPQKERIIGTHIVKYAEKLKKDEVLFKKQFGIYAKKNVQPENMTKKFEEVKSNIEKNNGK